jgi:hypothetical protein
MLEAHFNAEERHLLEISKIPANSGHSLHKGTPRETFIKEFLANHLSERVAIGTGEIIDANSKPNEQRNQVDIVIYKRNYPKIDFRGGINGFLVESVVATIEVKSNLGKEDLEQAIKTAHTIKNLQPSVHTLFTTGQEPPSILNYVVAYDGPKSVETVMNWIPSIQNSLNINPLPKNLSETDRTKISSPSIDGIFILGKGFIHFDNLPFSFSGNSTPSSLAKWCGADTPKNNLLLLFALLTQAVSGISGSVLNPAPYLLPIRFFESDLLTLEIKY